MKISKYLSDIGVKAEDLPWNTQGDRVEEWEKQREIYGFDDRDTWSLNYTIVFLLYPRLKMYREKAHEIIDLNFHTFNHRGKKLTQGECIDIILDRFEQYLSAMYSYDDPDVDVISEAWELFNLIFLYLWW
ncbi:MAG: hypothetical protein GX957_09575 [Clostridiaceae bacterium]|nr:hypothetical protein [Clostridiaceae bacterium]